MFGVRRLLSRGRAVESSARELRDTWIEWMRLSGTRDATITGYRQITDRFLDRWPELAMSEMTDDLITGFIEEARPASRQQRRGAFANWFGWAYRTKRIPRNPMNFVPTYRSANDEEGLRAHAAFRRSQANGGAQR